MLDTGALCSAARDEVGCHWFAEHFKGRLYTTDVIVEEIKNRARRPASPEEQLMKLAANDALRRLITPSKIEIASLDDSMWAHYDTAMHQLRNLADGRTANAHAARTADRHGGEASAIAWSKKKVGSGTQVVLVTNDGDASTVASAHGIEVRHFGHALHELVCASHISADAAWNLYQRATGMSGIPNAAAFTSATELTCPTTPNECAACATLRKV
ncbi:PIN domain-containing protein [Amycolatopsis sp. RTGN1]|uniref:PIN domain-containing protein n=1 Tax=Amycolatopsis ponsaeliensis TaxID=2992142 RepID=UPI00254FFCA9|nr:PIN domain-containing protein [Amycolatopsis sp. RTGN1]